MTPPRGLSEDEAEAWARVAASVVPLARPARPAAPRRTDPASANEAPKTSAKPQPPQPSLADLLARPMPVKPLSSVRPQAAIGPERAKEPAKTGLDGHWERRIRAGTLAPDFTLDLHEHTLDAAYQRLLGGLDIARETGARVVLVIAGRERPAAAADRGHARGAIRAKLLDWLAASRHAPAIAAIRKAHRRHGGDGALYIVLRRG